MASTKCSQCGSTCTQHHYLHRHMFCILWQAHNWKHNQINQKAGGKRRTVSKRNCRSGVVCYLWTLRGFSSSSERAFTLVRSCSSSRPRQCTSCFRMSMLATLFFRMCSSRLDSPSFNLSRRSSFSLSPGASHHWDWPGKCSQDRGAPKYTLCMPAGHTCLFRRSCSAYWPLTNAHHRHICM